MSHLQNFISTDDITRIFKPQLKQVNRDHLLVNQTSWNALTKYLAEVTLTIIYYFVRKNLDRTTYKNASMVQKTEWRSAILTDLHALDCITVDIHITSESGIALAQNINIRSYMNW